LISLSIFRKTQSAGGWPMRCMLAVLVILCVFVAATAEEPTKAISQYIREEMGSARGLPGGPIYAIAQTDDGYLWIGTERGLVRFDGQNFRLFQASSSSGAPIGPVLGLTTDVEGNLWVRLEGANLLRYRDGSFENMSPEFQGPEVAVTAMTRGIDGKVLLAGLLNGILRVHSGRFERLAAMPSLPNFLVISMTETEDGTIWMGSRDIGLFQMIKGQVSPGPKMLADRKINCLLDNKQDLWIGTDNGLARWDGSEFLETGAPSALQHTQILAMTRDRRSNIWIGTAEGLFRIDANGVFSRGETDTVPSGGITAVYEDREGNLWAGSTKGLDQLREGAFTTYSAAEGLPSDSSGPLYADADGRIWFARPEGGLYWLKDGKFREVPSGALKKEVIYSIAGGKNGIWIGRQNGGLTHYEAGAASAKTYTEVDGLAQNSVYAVYTDQHGAVWAGTLSGGVSQFREGKFSTYTTSDGLLSNTVTSILESANGTMWFGTPKGLSALSNGHWSAYGAKDGLPAEAVNCLLEDSGGVLWIGTASGLASIGSGRVWMPGGPSELLREPVFGIAEDQSGSLWVSTASHVLRVNRHGLLNGSPSESDIREYGIADGLRGTEGVKRTRSVVTDPHGDIWFSTNHGLSFVNPKGLSGTAAPTIVHIEQISADGRVLGVQGVVSVPAPHHRVMFSYAGVNLSTPERVRFKYMLDGFDHKWSDPTSSREATYTNLDSGSYRFRVIASNSDGVWNSAESEAQFEIEPLFWQRWWFQLSAAAAAALAILILFHLRMLRLSHQLNVRFEERLGERTRIAQELHDTLLQGVISASMQLHIVADRLPSDWSGNPALNRVLELMGRVIEEGRNTVGGLRSPQNQSLDLEQAFSQIQQEVPGREHVAFHFIVEGPSRPLHPAIRDEIYRIGREALINAFRHSEASSVEVELEYASYGLRVLVRDNGIGFDPKVLQFGRDGHWGLSGMRERSKRIGAKFRVLSRPAAGTEVELSLPSQVAFISQPSRGLSRWVSKLMPRWKRVAQEPSGERNR
jgi:ligand-binding sensor domain-containing protein/signal transduction histidine kinase